MYGIINQAIQQMVIRDHGEEEWLNIIHKSGIDIYEFRNHESYDDKYTYLLAETLAEHLNTHITEILRALGEFWIIDISLKKYPAMMATGGNSFREFLLNLPKFHNRVYLSYPDLIAPEFKINDNGDNITVEYHSEREGLTHLMEGMLLGIIKMFNEDHVSVKLVYTKSNSTFDHDLFLITWIKN
jgi:hypothetical protein